MYRSTKNMYTLSPLPFSPPLSLLFSFFAFPFGGKLGVLGGKLPPPPLEETLGIVKVKGWGLRPIIMSGVAIHDNNVTMHGCKG